MVYESPTLNLQGSRIREMIILDVAVHAVTLVISETKYHLALRYSTQTETQRE
ncbi:hypothetical protein SMKC032_35590 [Serratia marcescens]|nr:hypothetical protein SMKC032_35590 [Serratia marcescens]